jgi:fatty acid/phospholipid biosynthesis enzyme
LKRLTYENTSNDVVGILKSEFKRNLIRKVLSLVCKKKEQEIKKWEDG